VNRPARINRATLTRTDQSLLDLLKLPSKWHRLAIKQLQQSISPVFTSDTIVT
jgi:hypothetical protein